MSAMKIVPKDNAWRRANWALLIAIIGVNMYVIALPFLPTVSYRWQTTHKTPLIQNNKPVSVAKASVILAKENPRAFHADAEHDGLVIPRMLLDTRLIEGPEKNSFALLNMGAWRIPFASSPDKGGNTDVAGHRFSYTGPRGVFYYLDKLRVGDEIGLWYQGKLYTYQVATSRTVPATEVSVQQPTDDTRLTLYTCTPLWNPKERLVVVAVPKEAS